MESELPRAGARVGPDNLAARLARASVLIVDDEPGMRNFLGKTLSPHCRQVAEADSVAAAEAVLERQHVDVMLLDNMMPGGNGIDWLQGQRRRGALVDTILITAYADLDTAIDAMRAGAVDFVLKPFRSNQVLNAVRRCMDFADLRRENALLRHELRTLDVWRHRRGELIGTSPAIAAVRAMLDRVANLPTPVLISGESGTGKEVAARHLHAASMRAARPFVPVNCAMIPADRLEKELFGASGTRGGPEGLLVSAQSGTVFLDEVADLSASAQLALLRALEQQRARPADGTRDQTLDLRFLFATTRDLGADVAAGRFREDLLFRINVAEIQMPPLRQRGSDTVELTELYLPEIAAQLGVAPLALDSAVRAAILRHRWPGNIRELVNFIERGLILGRFPLETLAPAPRGEVEPLDAVERRHILAALQATGGNRTEAARRLGISRKTIDRKCTLWGL